MAAPADSSSTTAATTAGQGAGRQQQHTQMHMPLPRAIQLVMAISSGSKSSTSTSSTKTIGEYGSDRVFLWIMLVVLPSFCIAAAASSTYAILRDDDAVEELISGAGGYSFLALPILVYVYMAVLLAAVGHLGLFAPRTPYAAWDAFRKGYEWIGVLVMVISIGVCLLRVMLNQAWPLLIAWNYLLGLLVASTVAFWLCLLRTYGDGGGERRRENSSCGEAVIDGLAYLFGRLLYEFAVRFHGVADASGMQQLDAADVAV